MSMKFLFTLALVATLAAGNATASAAILFSDDFNGRTTGSGDPNGNPAGAGNGSSNWGMNNNGLGGTITGTYTVGPTRAGGRNQVVGLNAYDNALGSNGHFFDGGASIDLGSAVASSPNGMTIAFDFDRVSDPTAATGGNGYLAFGIGFDSVIANNARAIGGASWGILFQQAVAPNAGNARIYSELDTVTHGNFDYGDPNTLHSVLISLVPQISGSYGVGSVIGYSVNVDGNPLDSGTFTSNGNDFDIISFSANDPSTRARYIDNLVISSISAIPEPGSTLALGLLGAATWLRRRRSVQR